MRVVLALGGNALLRRGQALTADNQRANARVACKALAPLALEHQLVVSHGNGPQVGFLALQPKDGAYFEIRPEPDQALVVFNHPYAYMAHCDVHYADERLAA